MGTRRSLAPYLGAMTLAFLLFLIAWILGVVGTFVPALPATLIIFAGALGASLLDGFQLWPDLPFLLSFGLVTVLILLVDNVASAWGARRYGGSPQAVWGALIGGVVGIFIPFGLIVGPLAGALLTELLVVRRPPVQALRAAWGTLVGLLTGLAAKLTLHLLVGLYGPWRFWEPGRDFGG